MNEATPIEHEPWPLRAVILLVLGATLALAVHLLTRGPEIWQWTEDPARLGAAAALALGGIVFAFSLERERWPWSLVFAAGAGAVVGFVTFWNGRPENWGGGESWQLASALLAVTIAVPLFQASNNLGRWNSDYRAVHTHILTDIILWFAAWGFVLLTFLLVLLLSELFQLIGIRVLRDLLVKPWFPWPLIGGALGAAIGLLRDRDRIVDTLQRVATAILSVLTPILATGLLLFVLALPFTGLEPLWEQTRATTRILLACILGAVVLINAVIGSGVAEDEARPRLVRWAAAALAAVILPLAVVAAVSTGKRIAQHGFTPDRLWAAVFVAITLAGAAAYLVALVKGRAGWPLLLRRLNLRIAMGACLTALFLALPIVSFGAISTRDQIARLQSGRIAADKFDWAALRFDFGPSGRRALERLARDPNAVLRKGARAALAAKDRWFLSNEVENQVGPSRDLRVFPAGAPVPSDLREAVVGRPGRPGACAGKGDCFLVWRPADTVAVAVMDHCPPGLPQSRRRLDCGVSETVLIRSDGRWHRLNDRPPGSRPSFTMDDQAAEEKRRRDAVSRGSVEVREVSRRQVFIGGRPVGAAFE